MFFVLAAKKKSIAGAFLAVGAIGGVAGTYLITDYLKDEHERKRAAYGSICDCPDIDCDKCEKFEECYGISLDEEAIDDDEFIEIQCEDNVDESEFQ